jgi:hypothetical protein
MTKPRQLPHTANQKPQAAPIPQSTACADILPRTLNDYYQLSQNYRQIPTSSSSLPRLLPAEQTTRDATDFISRYYRAQSGENRPANVSSNLHQLQVTESLLPEAEKHLARIAKLSAPASKTQIASHLAVLLKSFPNGGKDDAQVFGRMLCEDVGAQAPTVGGIEAACRQLRRTSRFIPTISEVLEALAEVEAQQRKVINTLAALPEGCKRLAARVQDDLKREEEWNREDREQKEALARRQRAGEINADMDSPF